MAILGAIANPQMADIAGALDARQARIDRDEARRKEIRMGQLIAEAVPNLTPGSPLYEMATTSPREFSVFAKALGIPLNSGDKMQEMANDVGMLYNIAQNSPEAAFQQALDLKDQRNQAGMETPQLDKWIDGMREDPQRGMTALFLMHRSINGQDQPQTRVQSSQVLEDGTTIQVMSDGNTRVTDPSGNEVQGEQRAKAVRDAQQFGVDIQSQRAGGRAGSVLDTRIEKEPVLQDLTTRATEEAKNVTKTSKEYFDQLQNIEGNIRNYAEGIRLIREEGANSGVIARRLPSLKAASQKLDNLRNRLGLDVVSGTTFGALSEAELEMALDTGMPDNMQPENLAKWFEDRMNAQQKLADILDGAVQFLNVPGNSLADLRAMQKQQRTEAPGGSEQGAATTGIGGSSQPSSPSIDDLLRMY